MSFSAKEKEKIKTMFQFIVKKQHILSGGKSGFMIKDLQPILDELELEGKIIKRPTINASAYFLVTK